MTDMPDRVREFDTTDPAELIKKKPSLSARDQLVVDRRGSLRYAAST